MFKKKITLLLPLTFSPHMALLMWRFCPSDNGDHSGEYCSGYLSPKRRINIWSCCKITVVVLSDQCDGYNGALIWLSHAWMELWL